MGRFVLLDTPRLPAKVEAFGFRGEYGRKAET